MLQLCLLDGVGEFWATWLSVYFGRVPGLRGVFNIEGEPRGAGWAKIVWVRLKGNRVKKGREREREREGEKERGWGEGEVGL